MVIVLPPGVISQMPLYGVYLLMSKRSGVLNFTIRMIKKVIHFNEQKPLILHYDVNTDISLTYLSSSSINQQTVLLY